MIIENLALAFGVLADTVEVSLSIVMMVGGIAITHVIQRWADRAGEQPGSVNVGLGGGDQRYEERTIRR